MSTEHDKLVEECARAIQEAHAPGHDLNYVALYQARAAIAIVVERCALLADEFDGDTQGFVVGDAIRALLSPNDRGQRDGD